jgi:polar amino acid transport system substrate-binding protein
MKKLLAIALALTMVVALAACGSKDKDVLVCGVTVFDPMNYRDANGDWTGFDTEFALKVGEKLDMKVEFQLIEWSNKFSELDSGAIDAIWNGFTATAEENGIPRSELCAMSYSYMLNTQCIVVKSDRVSEFTSEDSLAGTTIAAEAGSAGEGKAKNLAGDGGAVVGVPAQINAFMEVMSGASDAAVIDIVMAEALVGTGSYADLAVAGIDLGYEVYAIGFRKDDPLRAKVNQAMKELYDDGTLASIAKKYGLEDRLALDTSFGQ